MSSVMRFDEWQDSNGVPVYDGTAGPLVDPGLSFINAFAFSGASSHSFGSDASPIFTADYTNYLIILDDLATVTVNRDISLRLRSNTTDYTGSFYYTQRLTANSTTVQGARLNGQDKLLIGSIGYNTLDKSSNSIQVFNPQTAKETTFITHNQYFESLGGPVVNNIYGNVANTSSYNGFTILSTGNFSGNVSIYGYRKA